ncbi:MAG TPA: YfhO family protein, partial [Chloroflexia bacterium]|nr:YfhO family protein [Chloroflexia bacterium]
ITEYTPNRIRAEVDATEAGWAVFSEVWYPGWEATVDGQPVPIERADTLFRAVAVAPGHHTIELHLQAPILRLGLLISGLTLLLTVLGGLAAFLWYRRARRAVRESSVL